MGDKWLCRYYEIIKKFAQDLSHTGIHCYIAVRKQHLYAIDRYVSKRCNHKTQLQLKELKSLAWKDVDEKWFNELINKKEEKLLQNIERNNSMNSTSSTSTSTSSSNNNNCERSLFLCTVILLSYILKTKVAPDFPGAYHRLSFSLSKLFYVDSLCWYK